MLRRVVSLTYMYVHVHTVQISCNFTLAHTPLGGHECESSEGGVFYSSVAGASRARGGMVYSSVARTRDFCATTFKLYYT